MTSTTVVQVSDTHLSESHAYFQDNWEAFLEEMQSVKPDLVVHSGDLTFNAPDAPEDLQFGRAQLDRLPCPWLIIPGNHDVGEPGENPRLGQPINAARMRNWRNHFGEDRFCSDLGQWRFIGLNSELMGSGLPEESEQENFFETAVGEAGDRSIGLFLHKPLYLVEPDETISASNSVLLQARSLVLKRLHEGRIRFIANGHIHSYYHGVNEHAEFVWCPTTAFIIPNKRMPIVAKDRAGYIVWRFDADRVEHELVEPALFANIDITNWSRQRGTSISLPPRALRSGQGG